MSTIISVIAFHDKSPSGIAFMLTLFPLLQLPQEELETIR